MLFRLKVLAGAALLVGVLFCIVGWVQDSTQITRPQLRTILEQLGYTVNDLETTAGKEKYSTAISRGDLNIPVAAELSSNGNYIWFTVFLGKPPAGEAAMKLLRANSDIQPSQFYVTKSDKLMLALCLENRNVTNAMVRSRIDKAVDDVVKTKETWQTP